MASRRMLSRRISQSKKVNSLSLKNQIIWTWIIPYLDDFGRYVADAEDIKDEVFPKNKKITIQDIEKSLLEASSNGLITLYEVKSKYYQQYICFEDFQTFRADRERRPEYPIYKEEYKIEKFENEKDIENYVIDRLGKFEEGITFVAQQYHLLYPLSRIPIGARRFKRIDILAEDKNGAPVLVEVKKGKVNEVALTQIKEYMALYKERMGRDCRGAIIAEEFSEKVVEESKKNPQIALWYATGTSVGDNDTLKLSEDKISKDKEKHLDNVFLTSGEYQSLIDRFGKVNTLSLIEDLDNYIGSKDKKYKSHYKTLLAWAKKDGLKKPPDSGPRPTAKTHPKRPTPSPEEAKKVRASVKELTDSLAEKKEVK